MARAKAKQEEIPMEGPGVAPVKIKAIDKIAEEYIEERDKRLAALAAEVTAKTQLIEALHFHSDQLQQPDGSLQYRFDDQVITLIPGKEKLKVSTYEETDVTDG